MRILCIIGLIVVLAFFFLAVLPLIFGAMVPDPDDFETSYMLGLIATMIIIITIISTMTVNFYFAPESFGYQEIVSENCVESEE